MRKLKCLCERRLKWRVKGCFSAPFRNKTKFSTLAELADKIRNDIDQGRENEEAEEPQPKKKKKQLKVRIAPIVVSM